MTLPSIKYLKTKAKLRLSHGSDPKAIIVWYAGILYSAAFIVSIIQVFLQNQMSTLGGLANMNARNMLETVDFSLNIIYSAGTLVLSLGYTAALLRISRNQYASHKTLKAGIDRIWTLLKTRILIILASILVTFGAVMVSTQLFLLLPVSADMVSLAEEITSLGTAEAAAVLDISSEYIHALIPYFLIFGAVYLPLYTYIQLRYRLADYILVDKPGMGARDILRQSHHLMKGNYLRFLLLDLSFFWYYLIVLCILLFGNFGYYSFPFLMNLGLPEIACDLLLNGIFYGLQFLAAYFFMNRVKMTYTLAYTSLLPKEDPPSDQVILGNIFSN